VVGLNRSSIVYKGLLLFLIIILTGCGSVLDPSNDPGASSNNKVIEGYVMKLEGNRVLVTDFSFGPYMLSGMEKAEVGQRVQVTVNSPVKESYPMQAKVNSFIVIDMIKPTLSQWTSEEVIRSAILSPDVANIQIPIIKDMVFHESQLEWEVTLVDGLDQSLTVTVKVK
jgi:hypothetical protein